jgi:fructokinase
MATTNESMDEGPAGESAGEGPDRHRPAIVGEVLFDVFPDGERVLGGAPFNVAWHLQAFGLRPLVVTRVGDDALGEEIASAMDAWGMDRAGVQVDPEAATGRVRVSLDDGGPDFDILADQAYDRIDADDAVRAIASIVPAVLYHGSLIARSDSGRAALDALARAGDAPIFIDVNLRDPWWRRSTLNELLDRASRVKLNDDELGRLAHAPSPGDGLEATAEHFAERHGLSQVVVTCGERGVVVWSDGRRLGARPPVPVDVVDTVGAGDAFSAVWITGAIRGWPVETTVVRALDFAAAICRVRGATTTDRRMYDEHVGAWENGS